MPKGKVPYAWCEICGRDLSEPIKDTQRTNQQNKSIHLFCELLADALNDAGLDQRKVLKPSIDIPWTKDSVKEQLWKAIQKAQFETDSTTDLTTDQVSAVYDTLNRHLGEKFGVTVGFPSSEMLDG